MANVAAILRAHELAKTQKIRRKHTRVENVNEDARARAEYEAFQHDLDMDEFNDIPDRLGKTGEYEPKSIYSPAPPSRFKVERPVRRTTERNDRDCELPADLRKRQTVTVIDGRGRVTGSIGINPYTRTIAISSPRFRDGQSLGEKRKAKGLA